MLIISWNKLDITALHFVHRDTDLTTLLSQWKKLQFFFFVNRGHQQASRPYQSKLEKLSACLTLFSCKNKLILLCPKQTYRKSVKSKMETEIVGNKKLFPLMNTYLIRQITEEMYRSFPLNQKLNKTKLLQPSLNEFLKASE